MKIVKLDKRWKAHDEGFTTAMRFDQFNNQVALIERWCYDNIGPHSFYKDDNSWRGYFGKAPKRQAGEIFYPPRPYYIIFKENAYISAILLSDLEYK